MPFWLAVRSVCVRVCKHGCGVKMFCFLRANHASTNLKKFFSSKLDNFPLFTHSFFSWNLENHYKEGVSIFHLSWQMVINLASVSLSNKKVNFYTCPRLTFLKTNATENACKSISEPLDFKIFPQTPLAARAFGINLASVSLSNKKVNFYTCPRLTFLKTNATENACKSISEPLDFKIFPQTPLAARAFGTWNLPCLVLKSGYGPGINGLSIQMLLRGENDSKQSDEIQARSITWNE